MNAAEIVKRAREEFTAMGKPSDSAVTGVSKTDNGWMVTLEVVEKKSIPDSMDVLGLYEIQLDDEGNLLSFNRKQLRKRGDTKDD